MVSQIEAIRRPDAYPDRFPVDMNLRRAAHLPQIEHSTDTRLISSVTYQGLTIAHPSAVADQPLLLPGARLHDSGGHLKTHRGLQNTPTPVARYSFDAQGAHTTPRCWTWERDLHNSHIGSVGV